MARAMALEGLCTPQDERLIDAFATFHNENPHVYDVLVQLTREYVDRTGQDQCGLSLVYGRARWELAIRTTDPKFALNNNFMAFYARMIMTREPDLKGVFRLRRSAADTDCARLVLAA